MMLRSFCAVLLATMWVSAAHAAPSAEEQAAAKETYIDGLRLLPATAAATNNGFRFGYVEKDSKPGGGRYSCGALTNVQADEAARIVELAFAALPQSAWQKIDMRYVLLCAEAAANGREIGGIPVPPLKLLMLGTGTKPSESSRLPYTALHELYHLIEMQKNQYADKGWDSAFSGYANSYGSSAGDTRLGSGGAGFVNGYATSFGAEERAELFAIHLLSGAELSAHIVQNKDKTLVKKKVALLKKCSTMLGDGACN